MNVMSWLGAFVASLFMAYWLIDTWSQTALGFTFIVLAAIWFVRAILSIEDDLAVWRGRREDDD